MIDFVDFVVVDDGATGGPIDRVDGKLGSQHPISTIFSLLKLPTTAILARFSRTAFRWI